MTSIFCLNIHKFKIHNQISSENLLSKREGAYGVVKDHAYAYLRGWQYMFSPFFFEMCHFFSLTLQCFFRYLFTIYVFFFVAICCHLRHGFFLLRCIYLNFYISPSSSLLHSRVRFITLRVAFCLANYRYQFLPSPFLSSSTCPSDFVLFLLSIFSLLYCPLSFILHFISFLVLPHTPAQFIFSLPLFLCHLRSFALPLFLAILISVFQFP
jgi:hypothetical protein